jgi:hypothetical protein
LAVLALCVLAISGIGILGATINTAAVIPGDSISRRDHEAIVRALAEQVSLIKWIGGGIVTSLVAAVGFLYRALERANEQSRGDLIEGIRRREVLVADVVKSNGVVVKEISELGEDVKILIREVRAKPL